MYQLYNGDCLDVMKSFEENSIDLTVTQPPYDNLRTYNGNISQWSFEKFQEIARELFRVTKNGGVVVWVVADATIKGSETGTSFKQALWFMECGFNLHDTMIYMKDNPPPVGGNKRYYQQFEYMFVFSKGQPSIFNPILEKRRNKWNDKRTYRTRPVTRKKDGTFDKKLVKVNNGDIKIQNVWCYVVSGGQQATDKIAYEHPAIFPEQLANDHILQWSDEGCVVLDPFMGSGTTGKMQILNNRNFIGIELDKEYFDISVRRIKEAENILKSNKE